MGLFLCGLAAGALIGITTGVPVRDGVAKAASPIVDHALRGQEPLRIARRRSGSPEIPAVPDGLMPPRPKIAIVIDDMGLSWDAFESVNALPTPVTLSFLPYGEDAQAMINHVKTGHDIMLHLPMEPEEKVEDAGPDMLRAGEDRQVIRDELIRNLSRVQGYSGVNNHTGSKFTADRKAMAVVLKELDRRGLFFLDSITTHHPVSYKLADRYGFRVVERNVFLDPDYPNVSVQSVQDQLAALERVAAADGYAIAIGHPYRATLVALETWLATAEVRGFDVVLVKDLTAPGRPKALAELR